MINVISVAGYACHILLDILHLPYNTTSINSKYEGFHVNNKLCPSSLRELQFSLVSFPLNLVL